MATTIMLNTYNMYKAEHKCEAEHIKNLNSCKPANIYQLDTFSTCVKSEHKGKAEHMFKAEHVC